MPAALYLLQRDGQFLTGHDLFLKRVGASFHAFIEVLPCLPFVGVTTPTAAELHHAPECLPCLLACVRSAGSR